MILMWDLVKLPTRHVEYFSKIVLSLGVLKHIPFQIECYDNNNIIS